MRPNLAQKMYAYAIPRRHTMPVDCAYEIVPRFKCNRLNIERVSELNSISTAWCVAENMMLAACAMGVGSCWINQPYYLDQDAVKEYSNYWNQDWEHDVKLKELGVPQD